MIQIITCRLYSVSGKGSNHRRVSFSEEDTSYEVDAGSVTAVGGRGSRPGRVTASSRQMTVPLTSSNMSYLTVPGQTSVVTVTVPAVAPQLSPEAKRAQTSAQARKRRATRLMKVGSFCSITSEGDGDIFEAATGQLKEEEEENHQDDDGPSSLPLSTDLSPVQLPLQVSVDRKRKQSDPLSEYSEFLQDDCYSDISDLFGGPVAGSAGSRSGSVGGGGGQETRRSTQGSVHSLTVMDQEELVFIEVGASSAAAAKMPITPPSSSTTLPPFVMPESTSESEEKEEEAAAAATTSASAPGADYESSGSASVASNDNEAAVMITVPVTIEPPPPEMRDAAVPPSPSPPPPPPPPSADVHVTSRVPPPQSASNSLNDHHRRERQHQQQPRTRDAGCQQAVPPSFAHLHGASSSASSLPHRMLVEMSSSPVRRRRAVTESHDDFDDDDESSYDDVDVNLGGSGVDDVKLILVRDIGVQVCGDSPNLNLNRRALRLLSSQPTSVSVGALPSAVAAAAAASAAAAPSSAPVTTSKSVQDVKNSEQSAPADFQGSESFTAEVLF